MLERTLRYHLVFVLLAGVQCIASGQQRLSQDTSMTHFVFKELTREPQALVPIERLIHYPELARRLGRQGKVTLQALINTNGTVSKVKILESADTIFDAEAIRAMKSETFSPAFYNGTPLKVWITRTINFRLN
jgi:TonB family protein